MSNSLRVLRTHLPLRKEALLDALSQVAIQLKLLDFIRLYRASRLQMRDCLTVASLRQGGGFCEAKDGGSSPY